MKRIETLYQLVARLQKVKEASRRDLEDYLDRRGYPVSSRTFDRCLHDIRTYMRLEVSYNPRTRTYSLPPKMEAETEARLSFLENYMIVKLVDHLSEDSANILKWILPEQPLDLPWLDNMYAIAAALQQKRQLQFQHRNFGDGILRSYVVHPYFLRQYRKRWYLVAMPEGQDTLLVFGIDRMSGAEVLPQASVRRGKATVHDFFRHMIGVSDATVQPVAIRIRVEAFQYNYLESVPLHASQEVLEAHPDHVILAYYLIPNYELKEELLKLGPNVEVLEPQWLRNEIKRSLQETLLQYERGPSG